MNWIDLVIIGVLFYYGFRGYTQGIISILVELGGYVVAYFISLRFSNIGFSLISKYLPKDFPHSYEGTLGVAVIWTITMFLYYLIAPFIIKLIPPFISHSTINKVIGIIGSLLKGVILLSIILFVLSIIPLPSSYANLLHSSLFAGNIQKVTMFLENKIGNNIPSTIGDAVKELSLIPNSNNKTEKLIELGYTLSNTTINEKDEATMFTFVNDQRKKAGLTGLILDPTLTQVGRTYGKYMYLNGFFSHITPAGQTPFDRVKDSRILFNFVGENIAKAPDVNAANTGFMNSPEHKANILSKDYNKIGIGVIDGGVHGKIFVQNFIGVH